MYFTYFLYRLLFYRGSDYFGTSYEIRRFLLAVFSVLCSLLQRERGLSIFSLDLCNLALGVF